MLIAANYGEPFSFSLSSFPRFSVELVERMDNENGVQQYATISKRRNGLGTDRNSSSSIIELISANDSLLHCCSP